MSNRKTTLFYALLIAVVSLAVGMVIASRLGVTQIDAATYESVAVAMEDMSHQCRPSSESFVNPAKSLALDVVGTLPVIWGGWHPSFVSRQALLDPRVDIVVRGHRSTPIEGQV